MTAIHSWVPLWAKSNYSFLEGASFPEELVEQAYEYGLRTIAITERNGVYGLARAHIRGKELGVHVIPGAELTVASDRHPRESGDPSSLSWIPASAGMTTMKIVALARSAQGYASLCRLISLGHAKEGEFCLTLNELIPYMSELFVLSDEPRVLCYLHAEHPHNVVALIARHLEAREKKREQALYSVARELNIPLVGTQEILYHDRARKPLQDVLRCIHHNCSLVDARTRLCSNGEHALRSTSEMVALFSDAPELLRNTLSIAERCHFSLDQIDYRYPSEAHQNGMSEEALLYQLTFEGARKRYPKSIPTSIAAQLQKELNLIEELRYGGYFLTMHEIVRFCEYHNIYCQGRGSAANSAVCYCLGITAVDPARIDLLFERFLSRERAEPPDIDLDIEHHRREEVIQHVYQKYGRDRAAMVANVIRYRSKSAVRDVGKAFGFEQAELDQLSQLVRRYETTLTLEHLSGVGFHQQDPRLEHFCRLTREILDFPRHLSIHPGGFLLGQHSVCDLVPIEPATMEQRTVIQWDKYDVEALGLFKVDLLGLGALSCVHQALDLIRQHENRALNLATIPPEDATTYDMISAGDTIGVFQIESRAQMAMLPRLKPRTFYDLVIEIAIVRPGPIQGDMVHPYLRRRNGEETVEYPHPSLEQVLAKTLGIPIFQEQVMKLAVLAGDYTPGEADQLRRDMAAWKKSGRIEQHHDRLVERMIARGIPAEFAERIFAQIRGFGEYGFPESHSASFALIAYVTAWLKRHHPAAFTCALLNSQPMGFYAPSTLIEDLKRHRVSVLPIDVQSSRWDCTLEEVSSSPRKRGSSIETTDSRLHGNDGNMRSSLALRMGFRYVKGFGDKEKDKLARCAGPYASLSHFKRATRLSEKHLWTLAQAGAFESLEASRRQALWESRVSTRALEVTPPSDTQFAALHADEKIMWDYTATSHSTRGHPMQALRSLLCARGIYNAASVAEARDGEIIDYAGMVICRQQPGTASGVVFCTLEDETGLVNVVLWRNVFEKYTQLARLASPLGVHGKLQVAEGVRHLIAQRLFTVPYAFDAPIASRDFH